MANDKKKPDNSAAGYEYTPGDGSAAEARDKARNSGGQSTISKSSRGYASGGGGGGSSRNTSPTVANAASAVRTANAVNKATGITEGYKPVGTYNDADLRAKGSASIDPITQYKIAYETAKAKGDQAGMERAHAAAEAYRSAFGYSGGSDGSENIRNGSPVYGSGGGAGYGATQAQLANMAEHGYNYHPGADIKLSGDILPGAPIFGNAGRDSDGYFDSSTAFYKVLPNGWRIPNTFSQGSLKPGDPFYVDLSQGSAWSQDAAKASGGGGKGGSGKGTGDTDAAHQADPMVQAAQKLQGGGKTPSGQTNISGSVASAFNFTPFEETEAGRKALEEYQGALAKMQSYKPFSYNPEDDPLYQQYADSYTRKGRLAMEDTLGQVAARTGGLASSYAGAMAQQTYDQYMAQLADKVPELRQLAYSMYVDDYNRDLGLYDRGYQRFADDYNRWIDQQKFWYDIYTGDRNFAYNAFRDQVGDQQWAQQFDWNKTTDARNYARDVYTSDRSYDRDVLTSDRDYEANRADTKWDQDWTKTQFDYQKEQDAKNWEMQQRQYQQSLVSELLDRVERGYVPTQEDADRLGLTPTQLAQYQNWARERNRQENSKYYAYGGY